VPSRKKRCQGKRGTTPHQQFELKPEVFDSEAGIEKMTMDLPRADKLARP
jgi:hypothetical protein